MIKLQLRELGQQDYHSIWQAMQDFTLQREPDTLDQIWLVQHPAVFTLGLNGKTEHLLNPGDIPIVNCDRGGQVTYHAPGQIMLYTLLDIKRRNMGVQELVHGLEKVIIKLLSNYGIIAQTRQGAPGVYVDDQKIAALGLRIKRGCSYHGLALNIDLDLEPFSRINPCGYAGLETTSLKALGINDDIPTVCERLLSHFQQTLGYTIQP